MSIEVSEIHADLELGRKRGIEEAFRALVMWPKGDTIHGIVGGDSRIALLEETATALATDASDMPGDIRELISEAAGEQIGSRFTDGAAAVIAHKLFWAERYQKAS